MRRLSKRVRSDGMDQSSSSAGTQHTLLSCSSTAERREAVVCGVPREVGVDDGLPSQLVRDRCSRLDRAGGRSTPTRRRAFAELQMDAEQARPVPLIQDAADGGSLGHGFQEWPVFNRLRVKPCKWVLQCLTEAHAVAKQRGMWPRLHRPGRRRVPSRPTIAYIPLLRCLTDATRSRSIACRPKVNQAFSHSASPLIDSKQP
jgi:hypothetical protein